ncbi:MAG TPA: glycosyltransferase [Anaerolineaceae bacterium]
MSNEPDQKILVGVWNYYEELNINNFMLTQSEAGLGDDLLRPVNQLYQSGYKQGIEFLSLDLIDDFSKPDAYLFFDFPRMDHPFVKAAFASEKPRLLILNETPAIKPDNWQLNHHTYFKRILTWNDDFLFGWKYKRLFNATDLPNHLEWALKDKKKLCTLIASNKNIQHPQELYSKRIETIRWFEQNHPEDFDLYGIGWEKGLYPSYRGRVKSKFETLKAYRFSICYENTQGFPGYITEKIFDSFKAACVPVYWGAPNISDFIPEDCFIDRRKFPTIDGLYEFLSTMSDQEYEKYLQNISAFLGSAKAQPFTSDFFAGTIISEIKSVLQPKHTPIVSVLIPSYNYGCYLEQTISSVLAQGMQDIEVIILDNASPDNTQNVVMKFLDDPRVTYIRHPENKGGKFNWLLALQLGWGKYLTILSADDFYYPDHLRPLIGALEDHPECDLAYTKIMVVDQNGTPKGVYKQPGYVNRSYFGGRDELVDLLRFDCYITPSAAVLRRSVVEQLGGFDEQLAGAGDYEYWLRLARRNPNFIHLDQATVGYRVHPGQHTNALLKTTLPLQDHILILEKIINSEGSDRFRGNENEIVRWLQNRISWYPPEMISPYKERIQKIVTHFMKSPDKKPVAIRLHVSTDLHHMRILMVIHEFPPRAIAGTEIYLLHLAQSLQQRGHSVQVLYPEMDRNQPEFKLTPDQFRGVPVTRVNIHLKNFYEVFKNDTLAPIIQQFLTENTFDLVHVHHLLGISATPLTKSKELGLPVVFTAHDGWLICEQCHFIHSDGDYCQDGPETIDKCVHCYVNRHPETALSGDEPDLYYAFALRRKYLKELTNSIDYMMYPSEFLKRKLKNHGIQHANEAVIPLGLPPSGVIGTKVKSDKIRFAYLGHISRTKGTDLLLEAFSQINPVNATLDIYGGIANQPFYHQIVANLKPELPITFHGAYTPDQLAEILRRVDVAVITSRFESYSIVVRECLSARIPVIAPAVGGIPEAVEDGVNGLLFEVGNVVELTEKMRFFVDHPEKIAEFSGRIRPVHTVDQDANLLENIYTEVIKRNSQPAEITNLKQSQSIPDSENHKVDQAEISLGRESSILYSESTRSASVDIVIPIYGQPSLARACVESVLKTAPNSHIILVDDCSPGNEIQNLFNLWKNEPNFTFARTPSNQGFIGATILGASLGNAPYIVFLNSDTEAIAPGWVEKLIPTEDDVAICGAKLIYPPFFPEPLKGKIQHAGVARNFAGKPYHVFIGWSADTLEVNTKRYVNAVTGACFLIRRKAWDLLGGWNLKFGKGVYEDVDLCWRARKQNYRILYNPDVCLYHAESQSKDEFGEHPLHVHVNENINRLLNTWGNQGSDEAIFFGAETYARWEKAQKCLELASRYLDQKNISAAKKEFHQGLEIAPDLAELQMYYALLLSKEGKHKEAIEHIQAALIRFPLSWNLYLHLIDELIIMGDYPSAAQYLRMLNQILGNNEAVLSRKKRIPPEYFTDTNQTGSPSQVEKPNPAETLKMLLDADDLNTALQAHQDKLDENLLDLVRQNSTTARSDGETDLADGLDSLADYIQEVMASRLKVQEMPQTSPGQSLVDIVIPVYGQANLVRTCVESVLRTAPAANLILIDDCSPGEEIPALFKHWQNHPGITTARNPENMGFIGTTARGASMGNAPYILFLNSDIEAIDEGWLERLIPSEPEVAITGALLTFPDDKNHPLGGRIQHAGIARRENGIPFHPFYGRPANTPEALRPRDVNAVTGACLLIRRNVWDELKGWETVYGLGVYEDVDLCWRARQKGYRIQYKPDVHLVHFAQGSSEPGNPHPLHKHLQANLAILLERWKNQPSDEALFFGEETVAHWKRAQELLPKAIAQIEKGNLKPAMLRIQEAVNIAPDCVEVLLAQGHLLAKLGKHKEAVTPLRKAILLAPDRWSERLLLVDELIATDQLQEAADFLRPLIIIAGKQPEIQLRMVKVSWYLNINTEVPKSESLVVPRSNQPSEHQTKGTGVSSQSKPETSQPSSHAAETLELLLSADDLPSALEQYKERLDRDLLNLIRQNIASAKADGEDDLAEGLSHLAGYVQMILEDNEQ